MLYFDNSRKLNLLTKLFTRSSAGLRFGSSLPLFGINDRDFNCQKSTFLGQKFLFLASYFNQDWDYKEIFSILKLKTFLIISEDKRYGNKIIKELKKFLPDLQISIISSDSIKNDFNLTRSAKFAILSNITFFGWASFFCQILKKNF